MANPDGQLAAYVDGELDAAEARDIERQLAADPAARDTVRVFRQTDALLREAFGPSFDAAAGPLPAALRPVFAVRRDRPLIRRIAALAAVLLFGVITFAAGYRIAGRAGEAPEELIDDVTGYHAVYARETDHLVEIPASRKAELAAWLGARLGRELVVPDLSALGFTFAGGRMLVSDNKPVAQLLYTRPGGMPLGVCVTRAEKPPAGLVVDHRNGVDVAWWRQHDYAYVVVGSAPKDDLRKVADAVAAAYGS